MKRRNEAQREQAKRQAQTAAAQWAMASLRREQLIPLLGASEGRVRWAAAEALNQFGKAALDALVEGLNHANPKIRASSALLMDHWADDRCITPLRQAMRWDSQEAVRRCAMHALVCDGCKECPLTTDVVTSLLEAAFTDRSLAVRRAAIFYLSQQRPDPRITEAMHKLLTQEKDAILLGRVRRTLESQKTTDA